MIRKGKPDDGKLLPVIVVLVKYNTITTETEALSYLCKLKKIDLQSILKWIQIFCEVRIQYIYDDMVWRCGSATIYYSLYFCVM